MFEFHIPLKGSSFYSFCLDGSRLLFAGSRHFEVKPDIAGDLIKVFGSLGFTFMTGCATGVDESFRKALADSEYSANTIIACAFQKRVRDIKGLQALFVVPDSLHPECRACKAHTLDDRPVQSFNPVPVRSNRQGFCSCFQVSDLQQQTCFHCFKNKTETEQSILCFFVKPVRYR